MLPRALLLSAVIATLAACGSTSNLSSLNTDGNPANAQQQVSLATYNRVIIRQFGNKANPADSACQQGAVIFSENVYSRLMAQRAFADVVLDQPNGTPNTPTPGTLVVDGDVTRYTEGNKALRLLVGMGAGSAYFDADVNIRDGMTNKVIAKSKVDLNSWGLGGGIAMSQTVDSFMAESSSKIATDIAAAKNRIQPAAGPVTASE